MKLPYAIIIFSVLSLACTAVAVAQVKNRAAVVAAQVTHLFYVAYQVPGGGNPGWTLFNTQSDKPTQAELTALLNDLQSRLGSPVVVTFWSELGAPQ